MTAMTQAPSDFKTKPTARPFSNPYVAGALLGLVLFAAFFFTGNGLGASGGLNRMIIWVIDWWPPNTRPGSPIWSPMPGVTKTPWITGLSS